LVTLLDKSLRRGLTLSDGDLAPFFTRPISAVFVVSLSVSIAVGIPAVRRAISRALMAVEARSREVNRWLETMTLKPNDSNTAPSKAPPAADRAQSGVQHPSVMPPARKRPYWMPR
jgi:hypothetical protein